MNTPLKPIAFCAIALVLMGCEDQTQVPPAEPTLQKTDGSEAVDKTNTTRIRTYLAPTEGRVPNKEIKGVACKAKADQFSVTFKSADKVTLPVFKGEPSPLVIDCETNDRVGRTILSPGKDVPIVYGASAAGLAALIVTSMVSAGSDHWTYGTEIYVVMHPKESQ